MKRHDIDKNSIIGASIMVFAGLLFVAVIALVIYVYVTYGNKPIDELPAWVLPFFLK